LTGEESTSFLGDLVGDDNNGRPCSNVFMGDDLALGIFDDCSFKGDRGHLGCSFFGGDSTKNGIYYLYLSQTKLQLMYFLI